MSRPETTACNGQHGSDDSDESRCQPQTTICKSEWPGNNSNEIISQDQRLEVTTCNDQASGNSTNETGRSVKRPQNAYNNDDSDESRCRPGTTVRNGNDNVDESRSRKTGPLHTDKGMDGHCKSADSTTNPIARLEEDTNSSIGMVTDGSMSRGNRCSISDPQWPGQLVTPVPQGESIDTTVINKQDVDECWVTNKHTSVKQDSILVSNKWFSGTFSKIAFSVWGKSKTGEEILEMENVHDKSKLTLTPEFNFSL